VVRQGGKAHAVVTRFHDRTDAGRRLGAVLAGMDLRRPIVLALPRGGVPVGAEIAEALGAPLEVFVARKIGAPGRPEYGIGAIAEGGGPLFDRWSVQALGISQGRLAELAEAERHELDRRIRRYRGGRPLPPLAGRTIVLVDDGLATGVTAEAALLALRDQLAGAPGSPTGPARLILAVPVCAQDSAARLESLAEIVCLSRPEDFRAVGLWYEEFGQTSDDEVLALLARHAPTTA
jgi:putative phosphoribosyl transferase